MLSPINRSIAPLLNQHWVNVGDYARLAVETTDDGRFSRAITAAQNNASTHVVFIPGGTFVVASDIMLKTANFTLIGAGADVTMIQAAPTFSGTAVVHATPTGTASSFLNAVSIFDLTIDQNSTSAMGILFESIYDTSVIERVRFANTVNTSIKVTQAAGLSISQGISIRDVMWNAYGKMTSPGVIIDHANEVLLEAVKVLGGNGPLGTSSSNVTGIVFSGDSRGALVIGCSAAWLDTGVDVQDAREIRIIGNTFEGLNFPVKFSGKSSSGYYTNHNFYDDNRVFNITANQGVYCDYAQYNTIRINDEYINLTANASSNLVNVSTLASNRANITNSGSNNVIVGRLFNQFHIVSDYIYLKNNSVIFDDTTRLGLAGVNDVVDILNNARTAYLFRFNYGGQHTSYKNINMNGFNLVNVNEQTFQPLASGTAVNGALFVDSADNKLKFKDSTGTVNLLY